MEYFSFLEELVKEAGEAIKRGYFGEINVKEKSALNYVTEIDLEVEEFLKKRINEKFPEHGILAEESGEEKGDGELEWIIDPLDGTTNFIHKIPICAISIALEKKGEVIVGAIYNPISDELFYSEKGKGSWFNGKQITINPEKKIDDWFLAWCYPDPEKNEERVRKVFDLFYPKCLRVSKLGSAALELCYVASNRIDGYISTGLKKWDYAAGKIIVEEAGGDFLIEKWMDSDLFIAAPKKNIEIIKKELKIN